MRGDECADSVPADQRPILFKIEQRLAQGGAGDAQLGGQLVLRRELLAGLIGPVLDEAVQVFPGPGDQRKFVCLQRQSCFVHR